ncbi:pyridoxal-phosphate dependent enzyme, partial [bacterium]|nr:pyridoxal-phosphate dependent enzyme [bacterium]
GAEPAAVDDAYRSLRDGVRHPGVQPPRSIADGLLTGIGQNPFDLLRAGAVEVLTVGEDAILAVALFFLQRMKIVVEPSSATVLAAMRAHPARFAGRRVGAILTGGNTDLAWLGRTTG